MIWLKRFAPLLAIGLGVLGYFLWTSHHRKAVEAAEDRMALITARTWVQTAVFADQQERFTAWRDSMLAAEGVTKDDLVQFLQRFTDHQEQYLSFARKVQAYVDSLALLEDSLLTTARKRAKADSSHAPATP